VYGTKADWLETLHSLFPIPSSLMPPFLYMQHAWLVCSSTQCMGRRQTGWKCRIPFFPSPVVQCHPSFICNMTCLSVHQPSVLLTPLQLGTTSPSLKIPVLVHYILSFRLKATEMAYRFFSLCQAKVFLVRSHIVA
jgi:hypothetical protein